MIALEPEWDKVTAEAELTPMFGRVRLRTLIFLRWLAVIGQTACLVVVHYGLGYDLPLGACLGAIAASAWVNAWLSLALPVQRFAKDWEAFAQLAYDLIQLMVLLALTGGLINPFSVMLVGPVVISVAALPARWWLTLVAMAVLGSITLSFWHLPLPWGDSPPVLPLTYQIGAWTALVIAIGFTAIYAWRVGAEARRMGTALAATQTVLAREQRLSALGALAAAAAHELGTPLATIQLTAKEMQREARDDPAMKDDADLIVSQAHRCREILQRLSQNHEASDRMHDRVGLREAMDEAAAPLRGLDAEIEVSLSAPKTGGDAPVLKRKAELIYGLGNFIENAVDYAQSRVRVIGGWSADAVIISIVDDGPGFPADILTKLGEPYITTRRSGPGHGGLGLGVFIAITLIERLGGSVEFDNASSGGAWVTVTLPRKPLEAEAIFDSSDPGQTAPDAAPSAGR